MLPLPKRLPRSGAVRLRPFEDRDAEMAMDLSSDPYVPPTGSLPGDATREQVLEWIARQHGRQETGTGYSFCIADAVDDRALGQTGLWLSGIAEGRASAGYGVAPRERGRGVAADALVALTEFAWSFPELHKVELYIEPWNTASVRTAERAGYDLEGLLRSHRQIGGRRVDLQLWAALRPG